MFAPAAFIERHMPLSANKPNVSNPVAPAIPIDVVRLIIEVSVYIL